MIRETIKLHTKQIQLERDEHGRLSLIRDGEDIPVTACPCFPWSHPDSFISLRDTDQKEMALLSHLSDLSTESNDALRASLMEASFMLTITKIDSIDKEFELRNWHVQTKQGSRRFQTRLDDWPRPLRLGGSVIHDVAGDQYHLPPLSNLDSKSRDLLWPLLDTTDV